jgi:hypothetical protein
MMAAAGKHNAGAQERLRVGDVDCETVKDAHFARVRHAFRVADDFLDGTLDFGKLGGGVSTPWPAAGALRS